MLVARNKSAAYEKVPPPVPHFTSHAHSPRHPFGLYLPSPAHLDFALLQSILAGRALAILLSAAVELAEGPAAVLMPGVLAPVKISSRLQ